MPPFVTNETWSDCLGFILLKIFNSMSLEMLNRHVIDLRL